VSARVPSREECVQNLRAVAAGVLNRLARAEAEGRLTPEEAVVVAQLRDKYGPAGVPQRPTAQQES
jgi:hypothetical protein